MSFTKGQEISGGNWGVFNSSKKPMQEKICPSSKIKKALTTISKALQLTYYLCLDLPFPKKKSTVGSTYTEYFFFSKSGYYAKAMPSLG